MLKEYYFFPWLPPSIISVWAPREAAHNETTKAAGNFIQITLDNVTVANVANVTLTRHDY